MAQDPKWIKQRALIADLVQKHRPDLLPIVESIGLRDLTSSERESLRGVVATELVETGFDDKDEPTTQGLQLEDLIDWLGEH